MNIWEFTNGHLIWSLTKKKPQSFLGPLFGTRSGKKQQQNLVELFWFRLESVQTHPFWIRKKEKNGQWWRYSLQFPSVCRIWRHCTVAATRGRQLWKGFIVVVVVVITSQHLYKFFFWTNAHRILIPNFINGHFQHDRHNDASYNVFVVSVVVVVTLVVKHPAWWHRWWLLQDS